MSNIFFMRVPQRRSDIYKKQDNEPVYLTAQGIEKLTRQLRQLKRDLPHAVAEVERTKEYGDFSENAEYKEAKYKLRRIHARILSTKSKLARAIEIKKDLGALGIVQIGSTVTVETNGIQKEYQILGSIESNPGKGKISYQSPLGSALLGKRVGDTVIVQLKDRVIKYTILIIA